MTHPVLVEDVATSDEIGQGRRQRHSMMVAMVRPERSLVTERLEVRPPDEGDRARFVDLFRNEEFMVFSEGDLSEVEANVRFDRMVALSAEIAFAKQPIVAECHRVHRRRLD